MQINIEPSRGSITPANKAITPKIKAYLIQFLPEFITAFICGEVRIFIVNFITTKSVSLCYFQKRR